MTIQFFTLCIRGCLVLYLFLSPLFSQNVSNQPIVKSGTSQQIGDAAPPKLAEPAPLETDISKWKLPTWVMLGLALGFPLLSVVAIAVYLSMSRKDIRDYSARFAAIALPKMDAEAVQESYIETFVTDNFKVLQGLIVMIPISLILWGSLSLSAFKFYNIDKWGFGEVARAKIFSPNFFIIAWATALSSFTYIVTALFKRNLGSNFILNFYIRILVAALGGLFYGLLSTQNLGTWDIRISTLITSLIFSGLITIQFNIEKALERFWPTNAYGNDRYVSLLSIAYGSEYEKSFKPIIMNFYKYKIHSIFDFVEMEIHNFILHFPKHQRLAVLRFYSVCQILTSLKERDFLLLTENKMSTLSAANAALGKLASEPEEIHDALKALELKGLYKDGQLFKRMEAIELHTKVLNQMILKDKSTATQVEKKIEAA